MSKSALIMCSVVLCSFLIGSAAAKDKKADIAAYFILTHTITDLDKYRSEYVPHVLKFIAKYGGQVVAASFDAEPLQGNPEKGAVVIRFPSEQAVRDFVNDPDYQPVKEIRRALTTNANAVLAPEFQMPES